MRKQAIILIALEIVVPSVPAVAATPLPPIVEAEVEGDVKDCATHDTRFEKGFMTRKDINADGKEDYILD